MAKHEYARLQPVCEGSHRNFNEFWSRDKPGKDAENRIDCPACGKRVKLRKGSNERFPNTIPFHHIPQGAVSESI